jgi:hypothetical protein
MRFTLLALIGIVCLSLAAPVLAQDGGSLVSDSESVAATVPQTGSDIPTESEASLDDALSDRYPASSVRSRRLAVERRRNAQRQAQAQTQTQPQTQGRRKPNSEAELDDAVTHPRDAFKACHHKGVKVQVDIRA